MKTIKKTLTFAFMDPPFESARTATFFRILQQAIKGGHDVNVFAYEGAVSLSFAHQQRHGNSAHGRSESEEDHPLPSEWIGELSALASDRGIKFSWVNCGLCADERGIMEVPDGVRRGSPADFYAMLEQSDNSLVIGTR